MGNLNISGLDEFSYTQINRSPRHGFRRWLGFPHRGVKDRNPVSISPESPTPELQARPSRPNQTIARKRKLRSWRTRGRSASVRRRLLGPQQSTDRHWTDDKGGAPGLATWTTKQSISHGGSGEKSLGAIGGRGRGCGWAIHRERCADSHVLWEQCRP